MNRGVEGGVHGPRSLLQSDEHDVAAIGAGAAAAALGRGGSSLVPGADIRAARRPRRRRCTQIQNQIGLIQSLAMNSEHTLGS